MKPSSIAQIDQQLKKQYHQICFNPRKREILLRLTDCSQQLVQEGFRIGANDHGGISNRMLRKYINGVYQKYGIQDPIRREFRLAKRQQYYSIAINGSPEKSLNLRQIAESDRLTKTKKKVINLKQSFKQDNQDIVYSSNITQTQPNISLRQSKVMTNRSRISKQIGYKTKEKIYFKTLPKDSVIRQIPRSTIRHQFSVQRSDHSKLTISFNNPQRMPTTKKEIPIIFRYCPICQQAILQSNIFFHQQRCKGLQLAYQMPYTNISKIVLTKIQRLEQQIQNQFVNKDETVVINQFNQLKQLAKSWVTHTTNTSFDEINNRFKCFAGSACEKINKLNWLKKLYKRIVMEDSIESSFR